MLGNGIKQTTSTTGTGDLTLSSVAGYPTFSDAFPLGMMISYALLDSAGLFIEAGVGYLSSSSTLVRARVSSTFVSSVYTSQGATAASLSGTTTVICTPQAATLESSLTTVDGQSGSVNRAVTTAHRLTTGTAAGMTTLRLSYVPFLLRTGASVVSLGINVTTAGAAGKIARLGMYTCNELGYPGSLLTSTSDFAIDSTGLKTTTLATPIMLPPGWYYSGSVSDGGPVITMHAAGNQALGGSPLGFSGSGPIDFRYEVLASAVLPAIASTTTTAVANGAQHLPMIFVGVS